MKILIIGTDANKSGASLSMIVLAKKAKEKSVDVRIVIPGHGSLEDELQSAGLKYYIVKSYNWIDSRSQKNDLKNKIKRCIKKVANLIAEIKIGQIINKYNPDIVHINTICSGTGAHSAIKKHKCLIWHIREFVEEDHGFGFWNKKKSYELMRKANLLIAISNSVYLKFSSVFQKQNIKIIYNGVDVDKFYYDIPHAFENKNSNINIYMGGSIAESKGQYLLIEAAKYLKDKGLFDFAIHIVGKGDANYISKLKTTVKQYGLDEKVFFDGFKNNMEQVWRNADIAVIASRAEAFGRVTVEAMLSGALVIGANTAGTAEIITDGVTGLLFESNNGVDLAEKIIYAVENKEGMKKVALEGRKTAKKRFTAEKNAINIIAAYRDVYEDFCGD